MLITDSLAAAGPSDARRRSLAIASVAVHVALGVALFGYSILHIEEIAPPTMALTFFSAPPPPPPPPPPAGHKAKTTPKVEVKPTPTNTLVQPMKDPPHEEKKPDPEPAGVDGGVKGGVAGGVVGGVVGGTLGGSGTQLASPKMVPAFTLAAQQVAHKDPQLPDWFMNSHVGQNVQGKYKVCIRQDGGISEVTALVGIPAVDEVVMQQIKANWLYKPQAVPVCTASLIIFKIK